MAVGGGGASDTGHAVIVASGKRIPLKEMQRLFRYELEEKKHNKVKKGKEEEEEHRFKEILRNRIKEYVD